MARTALKHGLYFGLPLAVLTAGAWAVQKTPQGDPRRYLRRAETFYQNGRLEEALRQAGLAADGLQKQLDVQQRLVEISPTASHYAGLAEVLYGRAWCRAQAEAIRQAMDVRKAGDRPARGGAANVELAATEDAVSLLRPDPAGVREAIRALERALEISGPWTNDPTKPEPDRSAPYRLLAQWYEEIGETEKARQVQAKAELKSPGAQAAVDVSSRRGDRGQ
ncbi:MAG: hypothetical protein HY000_14520 [Planctomycetes bacterium]|nr:hypothetical protein [Planctomycetota bacterium]